MIGALSKCVIIAMSFSSFLQTKRGLEGRRRASVIAATSCPGINPEHIGQSQTHNHQALPIVPPHVRFQLSIHACMRPDPACQRHCYPIIQTSQTRRHVFEPKPAKARGADAPRQCSLGDN